MIWLLESLRDLRDTAEVSLVFVATDFQMDPYSNKHEKAVKAGGDLVTRLSRPKLVNRITSVGKVPELS